MIALLQYKLWLTDDGIPAVWQLKQQLTSQLDDNFMMGQQNAALDAEVRDLKDGQDAIEERARQDLGMIRQGEVFYQVM